jgi:putative thioredoxin
VTTTSHPTSPNLTPHIIDVDEAGFQNQVLEASRNRPVVVDFWAEWCGPCRQLSPTLERVAAEGEGSFLLAKVDVDQNPRLSQAFRVQSIPTVIAFRDGRPVSQFTGAIPEAAVRQFVSQLLPPAIDPAVAEAEALAEAGDLAGAEVKLAELLDAQPTNLEAALSLAALLIDRGALDEATELLAAQSQTAEVKKLAAAIRLLQSGDIDLGDPESALPALLAQVEQGGEGREKARLQMIDLFDVLGPAHPLTVDYRRRLASALF